MRRTAAMITLLALGCLGLVKPSFAAPSVRCFVFANDPSPPLNTPYTPSVMFDAANGQLIVMKFATGGYLVHCALKGNIKQEQTVGNVQVTAVVSGDTNNNLFCNLEGWVVGPPENFNPPGPPGVPILSAVVRCFGKGGGGGGGPALADSAFNLLFIW
jgi:hypothetical protein